MSEEGCVLCGLPTDEGDYCCQGCRNVYEVLDIENEGKSSRVDNGGDSAEMDDFSGEEVFFGVDGMHCTVCESFLKKNYQGKRGIESLDANYNSGTLRVRYDPEKASRDGLLDDLSGYGYNVYELGEGGGDEDSVIGRLLVGGFFSMMVMLWYVLFLYPSFFGFRPLFALENESLWFLYLNIWVMASIVVFYTGLPILRGAVISVRTAVPNMDLLVALAVLSSYIYSSIAMAFGEIHLYFDVSIAIVMAVSIGGFYEKRYREKSLGYMNELVSSEVESVKVKTESGEVEQKGIDEIERKDNLIFSAGDEFAIDGEVVQGECDVDESLLTGEASPVSKTTGDEVYAGTEVINGGVEISPDIDGLDTNQRIMDTVWGTQSDTVSLQKLSNKISNIVIPAVVFLAISVFFVWIYLGSSIGDALLASLAVLIVTCPCALGIATPMAMAAGLKRAMEDGIYVLKTDVFENPSHPDILVFDKTGTLTHGEYTIDEIHGDRDILREASRLEKYSGHPLSNAFSDIEQGAFTDGGQPEQMKIEGLELDRKGISGEIDGEQLYIGSPDFVEEKGIEINDEFRSRIKDSTPNQTAVLIANKEKSTTLVLLSDELVTEWRDVLDEFSDASTVILTGDTEQSAMKIATELGIDEVYSELPPEAKEAVIDRLKKDGSRIAMIGDGDNDGPALAKADIGISMGSKSAIACNAADIAITSKEPAKINDLFSIAGKTNIRMKQNLGWAFLYNIVAIPMAITGIINPFFAAIAMSTSSLLVVTNSLRKYTD